MQEKLHLSEVQNEVNEQKENNLYSLENIDFDKVYAHTAKQFLKDLQTVPEFTNEWSGIFARLKEIDKMSDNEVIDLVNDKEIQKLLGARFEERVEEAYKKIIDSLNKGEAPIITFDKNYLEKNKNGLLGLNNINTYDKQKILVGTIGREPFKSDERIVCRIKGINPEDLVPRCTGGKNTEKGFRFSGVVVFKNDIPPEKMEILN